RSSCRDAFPRRACPGRFRSARSRGLTCRGRCGPPCRESLQEALDRRLHGIDELLVLAAQDGARVDAASILLDSGEDGGLATPKGGREPRGWSREGDEHGRKRVTWKRAATDGGLSGNEAVLDAPLLELHRPQTRAPANLFDLDAQHSFDWNLFEAVGQAQPQGGLERGKRELVDSHRA